MEENTIRSAARAFSLLETLAERGEMGVTELSVAVCLNKTTVFRQIGALISMGNVKKNAETDKYRLTFKLLELAGNLLTQIDMRMIARPHLVNLAATSGETVHLVQRDGAHIVYIDKVEPTVNSVRMVSRVGYRQPVYCTAVGKVILADLSDQEIEEVWNVSSIHSLTEHTIVDFDQFMIEIHEIRRRGYALDREENEIGVCCIAVSLNQYTGIANHAISVSFPKSRITSERIEITANALLDIKSKL